MDGTLTKLPLEPEPHPYLTPGLSPDGRRVVACNGSMIEPGLWVFDLQRGSLSRPVVGFDAENPIWTPDGRAIVFRGTEKGRSYLFRVPADGSGPPEKMTRAGSGKTPACWGRDGQELVAVEHSGNDTNIIAIPMNEPEKARPLVQTPFVDKEPAVSPDNRWLAYSSGKSGRSEVYVQPYAGGEVVQVSVHGGAAPLWSRDGHRLFYRESTTAWTVHSVEVGGTAHFEVTPPRTLGALPEWRSKLVSTGPIQSWQLMPDGKSFLVVTIEKDDPVAGLSFPKQIQIVLNWFEELKAKVPVNK